MGPSTSPDTPCTDDNLLLPSAGFYADASVGAGHVHLPDDFFALDPDLQIGILAGWRTGVERLWRRSLIDWFRARQESEASLALPERIERFRCDCKRKGFDLPNDFALYLQQY